MKQFELANTPLSDENIVSLSEWATKSKHLQDLNLEQNDLLPQQLDLLLKKIKRTKKLQFISIAYNNLMEGITGNNL